MSTTTCDLVVPPSRDDTVAVSRSGFFSPLGLLSIATYAGRAFSELNVRVWDGNITPESKIRIRPDAALVGFSPTILSYESCLRLAQRAKANGSIVVFGGYQASSLGKRVLEANDFVDYVVDGDGELPFTELLRGRPAPEIPGLIYRTEAGIQRNPIQRVPLDSYPFSDRSLLDRHEYVQRFQDKYLKRGFHIPDLIYSQKDCMWAAKTGGCVFCARIDKDYRARAVEKVWDEIFWLHHTYGTDYVWDVTGSFIGNPEWVRAFHAARPKESGVALEIYGRAAEIIGPGMAQMMEEIGVHKVFIGAESGDQQDLRLTMKGATPGINLRAARLCAQHGIALSLGFVVGLPGETEESLGRTLAHVRQLVSEAEVETISCAILLPIPGSRSFQMLVEHRDTTAKYQSGDHWDLEGMQRDWLRLFTSISYEYAVEVAECILSHAPTQSAILRFQENARPRDDAMQPLPMSSAEAKTT
ncbi:MAG: B12-binding domain-containing radical SAM protein [Acidobacteria bacterium]|nr:B12-binding domain-containing radical SAM protein [Acidobacteriota bacterium]MBI3655496.1 B12-binding domain-containing radical SAM protein [Acidobacteriota bacterium]